MAEANSRTPREETTLERADRNFGELLQELRIIQAGVQILFAFLLTLAFTPHSRRGRPVWFTYRFPAAAAHRIRTLTPQGGDQLAELTRAQPGERTYPDTSGS